MRKGNLIWLLILLYGSPILLQAQPVGTKKTAAVIFDTDMGPDYDDVGALAILHALADNNECRILATMASDKHKRVAAVLQVLNTYFKRPGIPIGVVKGAAVDIGAPQKWDSLILAKYPHTITSNEMVPDATELYRKILAGQPDNSVTIITVGFLTNMRNLLQSKPDKYSSLAGKALVAKKVKQLVSMAACFDRENFKEYNVKMDIAASQLTFDNWPTPIIFSGFEIGVKILTGLPIANSNIAKSPVKDVFAHSIPLDPNDKNGRMSWDETAVLVAVRGHEPYFSLVKGRISCRGDGSTTWNGQGTRDHYLVQKMPVPQIEKLLNDLIMHQPLAL